MVYVALFIAFQVNQRQHFRHPLFDLIFRHLLDAQTERDILKHVQMRKQCVTLKHCVHMAFMRRQVVDAFPLEENVSLFRIHKAADDTQRRCFSAAGRTEEGDEFLVVDIQVESL